MKRFIALALALLLCVSLLSVTAFATESGYMYISSAEAEAGQTVTLSVGIGNNPGVAGIYVSFAYDGALLEKVAFAGTGMNGQGVWTVIDKAIWDNAGDVVYDGQVLTLTFKVAEDANVGDVAKVTINYTLGNWAGECVGSGSATGTVTVVCAHAWDNGVVTKEPTCTEDGVMTYTCSKCGETKTEAIPAAHSFKTEWNYDDEYHWHDCSFCDEKSDKAAHSGYYVVDYVPAEGENNGYRTWKCGTCNHRYTEVVTPSDTEDPKVGDIRPMMLLGFSAVLFTLTAASYVFKRKVNV